MGDLVSLENDAKYDFEHQHSRGSSNGMRDNSLMGNTVCTLRRVPRASDLLQLQASDTKLPVKVCSTSNDCTLGLRRIQNSFNLLTLDETDLSPLHSQMESTSETIVSKFGSWPECAEANQDDYVEEISCTDHASSTYVETNGISLASTALPDSDEDSDSGIAGQKRFSLPRDHRRELPTLSEVFFTD